MNLSPLLDASLAIQIHTYTAIPAVVIGALVLTRRKGTPAHRAMGRVWIVLMVVTALSSFFIHHISLWGSYSPIHLLSIVTLISCGVIVWSARTGKIRVHRTTVRSLYFGGLLIAGAFTVIPGRVMHAVLFGPASGQGLPAWFWTAFAIGLGVLFGGVFLRRLFAQRPA